MRTSLRCGVLLLGLGLPAVAAADSIWDRADPQAGYLFTDTRARHVGDLLTIVVRETTDIENKDNRDLHKDNSSNVAFDFTGNITGNSKTAVRNAKSSFASNTRVGKGMTGTSEYTVDQKFTDRVTVVVTEVLPNGYLVIHGERTRFIAGELRLLHISGIVRPIDVQLGNFIESSYVGNFQVSYKGRGPESKYTNPGWFHRCVSKVWPF